MDQDTDSQLQAEWESTIGELQRLEKSKASDAQLEPLITKLRWIKRRWLDVLDRKARGELTDPVMVESVIKSVKELAALLGIPVTIGHDEPDTEGEIPQFWGVVIKYAGERITTEDWGKFHRRVIRELEGFDFFDPADCVFGIAAEDADFDPATVEIWPFKGVVPVLVVLVDNDSWEGPTKDRKARW